MERILLSCSSTPLNSLPDHLAVFIIVVLCYPCVPCLLAYPYFIGVSIVRYNVRTFICFHSSTCPECTVERPMCLYDVFVVIPVFPFQLVWFCLWYSTLYCLYQYISCLVICSSMEPSMLAVTHSYMSFVEYDSQSVLCIHDFDIETVIGVVCYVWIVRKIVYWLLRMV